MWSSSLRVDRCCKQVKLREAKIIKNINLSGWAGLDGTSPNFLYQVEQNSIYWPPEFIDQSGKNGLFANMSILKRQKFRNFSQFLPLTTLYIFTYKINKLLVWPINSGSDWGTIILKKFLFGCNFFNNLSSCPVWVILESAQWDLFKKTTFCGFIALLNKVLDFGGQLFNKLSFLLSFNIGTVFYFIRNVSFCPAPTTWC